MTPATPPPAIESELTRALDELLSALRQAGEAAAAIRSLAPRLAATGSVLDEIAMLIASGRGGGLSGPFTEVARPTEPAYTRPTLVVPSASSPPRRSAAKRPASATAAPAPVPPSVAAPPARDAGADPSPETSALWGPAPFPSGAADAGVTCFRLEFESAAGRLDLRRVDDAVAAHPAVRDVALLDYDGRRATLKVWLAAGTTPSDVQQSLKQRAAELFSPGDDVRIVALEDAA